MKPKRKDNRKRELVFDNSKRESFLKGFSKRKKLRQLKAKGEIELQLKEECKKIKLQAKDIKSRYKKSFAPIEDVKNEDDDEASDKEEYETDKVKVSITTIDDKMFAGKFIGPRKIRKVVDEEEEESPAKSSVPDNEIEGMDIRTKKKKLDSKINANSGLPKEIKSEKDLKKIIKKQTKTALKKSKAIQKQNQMNHKKNVKKSNKKKNLRNKMLQKRKKFIKK